MQDFFLCNKFTPYLLDEIKHNQLIVNYFKKIKSVNELSNIILYGVNNSGKYTILKCFLNTLNNYKQIKIKKLTTTIENNLIHYEIDLKKDNLLKKKEVLQAFLKSIISTKTIFKNTVKLIVIRYFDKLCKTTQYSLRRTMETYSSSCRFIFITSKINKIIPALQSRCQILRFKLPDNKIIFRILEDIIIKEKKQEIVNESILSIILYISNNNILEAINNLQLYLINPKILFDNRIQDYCNQIFIIIQSKQQFYNKIHKINDILYELMLDNIDLIDLLKVTIDYLINNSKLSKSIQFKIIDYICNRSYYMIHENKSMIHIKDIFCYIVKITNFK